jgi:hypothetical protein
MSPARPPIRLQTITAAARTTPGRLGLFTVALLVLCLVFGLASAASLQSRSDALGDVVTSSQPLAVAAQDIYRSLSDADATAASAFLAGGVEPRQVRQRYESDIAQAGTALAAAASAARTSEQASRSVAELSTYLPVYTGLVEAARANNRRGLPVGAAYLREASGLMSATLLPAARQLYDSETARLASTEDRATPVPWLELLVGLLTIGALVAAGVFLRRRTNRVFNVGLLAATVASLLVLLWVVVTAISVSVNVGQAREHGSAQVQMLATARIAALEARGAETLTLVARGAGSEYEEQYGEIVERLGGSSGLLNRARDAIDDPEVRALVDDAMAQLGSWRDAHGEIRRLDDSGEYNEAVTLAIGDEGAGPAFTAVDERLGKAIALSTQRFDAEVAAARSALSWSVPGVVLLMVLAVAGIGWGMWQRLKEYR